MRPEHWLFTIPLRLRSLFGRRQADQELDDELRDHVEQQTEEYVAKGLAPKEAYRQALLEMGGIEKRKEECRDTRRVNWAQDFFQDVCFAVRMLRKSPGFAAIAILTLALGIGANTAIFSLIDALMLRSLAVRNPQELFILKWAAVREPHTSASYFWSGCPGVSNDPATHAPGGCTFSYPMFEELRSRQDVFSDVSAFVGTQSEYLTTNGSVTLANGSLVSGNFFATLGTHAVLGRTLDPMDDEPSSEPAVVLSYAFWQGRFGGDPSIIGKSILVENIPFTIVGVAAPEFAGLDPGLPVDLWMPLSSQPRVAPHLPKPSASNSLWIEMIARLQSGIHPSQAQSAASTIFAASTTNGSLALFKPSDSPRIELINAAHGLATLRRAFSEPLFFLMASVGIILLIACANIGGLALARASSRRQEVAMRLALGASRSRIARQFLTESLLTSTAGAFLGVLLAYWSASALAAFLSSNWYSPIDLDVRPDGTVLAFTVVVTVLSALLFGLAPALQGTRVDLAPALKGGSNKSSPTLVVRRFAFGGPLVVGQVALSVVILAGAGLLVRTLVNLQQTNVGFKTDHLLLFRVDVTMAGFTSPIDPRIYQLNGELQARLSALPGVSSTSYSMVSLLSGTGVTSDFKLPEAPASAAFSGDELPIGPGFFETLGIPLVSGRNFTAADFQPHSEPQSAVVNQLFAEKLFGKHDPLGRTFSESDSMKAQCQVIGVVGDAKYDSLRAAIAPTVYTAKKFGGAEFEMRTRVNPTALIPEVRDTVRRVNGKLLVSGLKTQTDQINQQLYQERLVAGLSSLFAGLALLLACIGLYGLLSCEIASRTHEIGIRVAFGAQSRHIVRMVLREGFLLVFIGTVIGIAGTLALTRFLRSMLFEIKPTDPATLVGVALLLVIVALLACYIPARRATRVDPMVALRYE